MFDFQVDLRTELNRTIKLNSRPTKSKMLHQLKQGNNINKDTKASNSKIIILPELDITTYEHSIYRTFKKIIKKNYIHNYVDFSSVDKETIKDLFTKISNHRIKTINKHLRKQKQKDLIKKDYNVNVHDSVESSLKYLDDIIKSSKDITKATKKALSLSKTINDDITTKITKQATDFYIWVTCKDDKVRPTHRELDNKTFSFKNPPLERSDGVMCNPGEDWNCRCGAKLVYIKNEVNNEI